MKTNINSFSGLHFGSNMTAQAAQMIGSQTCVQPISIGTNDMNGMTHADEYMIKKRREFSFLA